MAVRARVRRVEVERIVAQRQSGKERVVALVQGAAPMMFEDSAHLEILEQISLRQLSGLRAPVVTHMPFPRFILDVLLGGASAMRSIRSGLRVVISHPAGIAANYGRPILLQLSKFRLGDEDPW